MPLGVAPEIFEKLLFGKGSAFLDVARFLFGRRSAPPARDFPFGGVGLLAGAPACGEGDLSAARVCVFCTGVEAAAAGTSPALAASLG